MWLAFQEDDPPTPSRTRSSPNSSGPGNRFGLERRTDGGLEDYEIVQRVLDGDSESYRWIVERYQARVFTHIFRIVHQAEDAEEIAQDAFLRAFQALDRFDPSYSFSTWLLTIATRLALNARRRRQPTWISLDERPSGKNAEPGMPLEERLAAGGESPEEALVAEELRGRLEEATERLPDSWRAVFNLRFQEDLPLTEIGRITGMSLASVKVTLHRARRFLRDWIG